MKQRGPYGYLCEVANPPFKFFVENATGEDGQPIVAETDLGNGMKVFPIWREERHEVLPKIHGYAHFDFETRRRTFVDLADYDENVHTEENEWFPVTEVLPSPVNLAFEHSDARQFHDNALEAFSTWKYLPQDVPQDVRDRLKSIYDDKAKVAFAESYRLGFGNRPVSDDEREGIHREMASRHRELARIYSY